MLRMGGLSVLALNLLGKKLDKSMQVRPAVVANIHTLFEYGYAFRSAPGLSLGHAAYYVPTPDVPKHVETHSCIPTPTPTQNTHSTTNKHTRMFVARVVPCAPTSWLPWCALPVTSAGRRVWCGADMTPQLLVLSPACTLNWHVDAVCATVRCR